MIDGGGQGPKGRHPKRTGSRWSRCPPIGRRSALTEQLATTLRTAYDPAGERPANGGQPPRDAFTAFGRSALRGEFAIRSTDDETVATISYPLDERAQEAESGDP